MAVDTSKLQADLGTYIEATGAKMLAEMQAEAAAHAKLATQVKELAPVIAGSTSNHRNLASAVSQATSGLTALPAIIASAAGGFGLLAGAIAGLTAWLNPEIFKAFGMALQLSLMPILTALIPVLNVFLGFIVKVGVVIDRLAPLLAQLAATLSPVIDAFLDVGVALFQVVGRAFLLVANVLAVFLTALEPVANVFVGVLDEFSAIIKQATPLIVQLAKDALPSFVHWLGEAVKQIIWVTDQLVNAFVKAVNAFLSFGASILEQIPGMGAAAGGLRSAMLAEIPLYQNFTEWLKKMEEAGKKSRDEMNKEAAGRKALIAGSMGPKGGIGNLEDVWKKAMSTVLGESPAEREKRTQQWQQQIALQIAAGVGLLGLQGAR